MTCALMRLSRGENSAEQAHEQVPCWPEAPSNRTTIGYYGIDHRLNHCRYS